MTEMESAKTDTAHEAEHGHLEEYAGGYIKSRHGYIPLWLLAVYAILFVWALYYLVVYWGGLGPGRPV
jgi:hypothetical protein